MTTLDPAVAFNGAASNVDVCNLRAGFSATPTSRARRGLRLVPDAARALPTVSKDGRSYTFTIRPGLRFSPPSNQSVTAQTFKYSIERSLRHALGTRWQPPGRCSFEDVVGAPAYFAGKARHIAGVEAHGDRLTIHLTEPAPDLPARLAIAAVLRRPDRHAAATRPRSAPRPQAPTTSPRRHRGGASCCSATPTTTVTARTGCSGSRSSSARRTRSRRSKRRSSTTRSTAGPAQDIALTQIGRLSDTHRAPADLRRRYHASRTTSVDYLELNTRRPTFHDARMRRAASYAIDRRSLAAAGGTFGNHAVPAQMELPQGIPGYRDDHVYPLVPDLTAARRLVGSRPP